MDRAAPPLRAFGLVLHHDGRWSHQGRPIAHRRLREHFDRSVRYLPEERCSVVTLRQFRALVEVEEASFFVRELDLGSGEIRLSDGSREILDPSSLQPSPIDGALLCRVKRTLLPEGVVARFDPGVQAELLLAVEEEMGSFVLPIAGRRAALPPAVL